MINSAFILITCFSLICCKTINSKPAKVKDKISLTSECPDPTGGITTDCKVVLSTDLSNILDKCSPTANLEGDLVQDVYFNYDCARVNTPLPAGQTQYHGVFCVNGQVHRNKIFSKDQFTTDPEYRLNPHDMCYLALRNIGGVGVAYFHDIDCRANDAKRKVTQTINCGPQAAPNSELTRKWSVFVNGECFNHNHQSDEFFEFCKSRSLCEKSRTDICEFTKSLISDRY